LDVPVKCVSPRSRGGGHNLGVHHKKTEVGEAGRSITMDVYIWLDSHLSGVGTLENSQTYSVQGTMNHIIGMNCQGKVKTHKSGAVTQIRARTILQTRRYISELALSSVSRLRI
jgi:hypothetical protein